MIRSTYRLLRSSLLHHLVPENRNAPFANGRKGVEVVGLFHNSSGLGESARLCAAQLRAEGFKVRCVSVEPLLLKNREFPWEFENDAAPSDIGARIIHLNPPMIPPYALLSGIARFGRVFNIGYWAWELENLPPEWVKSLRYINAVMTPSDFTSTALRRYTDKPVRTVPHPVRAGLVGSGLRNRLNIPEDAFVVTSIFSFQSALERKNPQALIAAFLAAFPQDEKARLVFKIGHLGKDAPHLRELAATDPRILLIDEVWPRADVLGLIKESDLYASLHRAEGFGLAMAEAMLLGTPVMATNWSGNTDFCRDGNFFPVRYKMAEVHSSHAEFARARHSVWAEADIDDAARILQSIRANPQIARERAEKCLRETNHYFKGPFYQSAFDSLIP